MLFINLLKNKKKILNIADTPYVNGCFPNRFNYNTIKVINRFQLCLSGVASKFLLNKCKICKKGFVLNFFLNWIRMLTKKKNVSGVTNRLLFYKYKIFENVLYLNLILNSFACSRKKKLDLHCVDWYSFQSIFVQRLYLVIGKIPWADIHNNTNIKTHILYCASDGSNTPLHLFN